MSLPIHIFRSLSDSADVIKPSAIDHSKPHALFVGYAPHRKTLSSNFFTDNLCRSFNVWRTSLDHPFRNLIPRADSGLPDFDLVVIFQVHPSVTDMKRHIRFRKAVICPMADQFYLNGESFGDVTNEYRGLPFVSFSKRMHDQLTSEGFHSSYFQYFPETSQTPDLGDARSAFLWERLSCVTSSTVAALLSGYRLDHLHVHAVRDDHQSVSIPSDLPFTVTQSTWFESRDAMTAKANESALYFAPRHYEGIGMSFLEAMANGRCVIAPDETTMNEYVKNGQTGLLYDLNDIRPLRLSERLVRDIQRRTRDFMVAGRERWMKDRDRLLDLLKA